MISPLVSRSEFPVFNELTYLNTASMGLMPLSVHQAARRVEEEIALRGTTWFDEVREIGILERARKAAASRSCLRCRRWGPRVDSFGVPEFRPTVSTDSGSSYRRISGCTGAMSACLPVQALFDDVEHFHEMIVRLASQPVSSR